LSAHPGTIINIGWIARLLKVSFNMPGLLKKFPSNNKLARFRST